MESDEVARLRAQIERQRHEADELARVARLVSESFDLATVGERIAESVLELLGVHSSAIRPVLLKPLLSRRCDELAGKLQAREPAVTDDLAVPEVSAEREGLREAVANLLSNAVKFSPARSGAITVRSYREGDLVVIAVADRGVGFDMKYHDRIFGIFERLHSDEEYPGTGVGLAIVRKVAEHHGGCAWAQSRPGAGGVFFLAIPA